MIAVRILVPEVDERPLAPKLPSETVHVRARRLGSRSPAWTLASRLRALEDAKLPPLATARLRLVPFEEARARSLEASLQVVGHVLGRPALKIILAACAGAVAVHVAFGSWSLALRPHKARTERIAMAVAAADEQVLDEPELEPDLPEPPPSSTTSAARAAASAPSLVPSLGPVFPGLAPVGPGGGAGMNVGGDGPRATQTAASAPAEAAEPRVEAPRARTRPAPAYPRRARDQGIEGRVVLQLLVDEIGAVTDVRVLESDPAGVFDEAAIAAVRRWSFAPGTTDGRATSSWVRQVVRFALDAAHGSKR